MILQYSNNGNQTYEEAVSITVSKILIGEKSNLLEIMEAIGEKISDVWGKPCYEKRTDELFTKDAKFVKYAILSDRNRTRARALLFNDNTTLFMLNNDGKTLQIF